MFRLFLLLAALPAAATGAAEDLSTIFDQPPEALAPAVELSEADQRRLAAAALYAQARLDHRRLEFGSALRRLQRAWRYRPAARQLLPEIIAVAHDLRRTDETVRYALLAGEQAAVDPLLLKRLALQLSSQQQWRPALRLYELALQQEPPQTPGSALEVGDALLLFDMGRISFALQEFDKAAQYFGRVQNVLEDPQQLSENLSLQKMLIGQAHRTYQLLAESYLAAGQLDRATAMFRKAHQAESDEAGLAYALARIDARSGRDQQALERLETSLRADAAAAERGVFELLAELLSRLHPERAEQELLARLEPLAGEGASATLLQFLGDRYRAAERWTQAELCYGRIIDDQPTAAAVAGMLEALRPQRRCAALLESLSKAAAAGFLLQDLDEAGAGLAADEALVEQLLGEAERRLKADPEGLAGSGAALAAADLAIASGRYAQAQPLLDAALQVDEPDVRSRALLNWGVDLLLAGQYSRAAALFRRGVDEPLLADRIELGHFYLVRALVLDGKTEEALQRAEAAVSSLPDALRLQSLPAWVLARAERYDEALSRYVTVLQRLDTIHDNSAIREETREIRVSLSSLAVEQGDLEQAAEWLEQVLDEFPEDPGALNDLGYLWADQRKYLHWALEMIQKAVHEDPENRAYLDSLGWVYYRLERYEQAVEWLEKAAAGDTPDGVILDHLGDAYWRAGRAEQARASWQRAAEQFGEAEDSSRREVTLNKIKNPPDSIK